MPQPAFPGSDRPETPACEKSAKRDMDQIGQVWNGGNRIDVGSSLAKWDCADAEGCEGRPVLFSRLFGLEVAV